MKKVAVLVFGEFREFEIAHKTWEFLNNINYDMFISTWNKSYETNEKLNIFLCEDVTENQIRKYFPDSIINIEPDQNIGMNSSKMIYHWRKLFNMMQISGNKYDKVILMRCDIGLKKSIEIESIINGEINNSIIYGLSEIIVFPPPEHLYVCDCMFIGETNIMRNTFLSFFEPDITKKCIHYFLAKHFIENDIYVERIIPDIDSYFIFRSIHRKHEKLNYEKLKMISEIYEELKHHHHKEFSDDELLNKLNDIK